MDKRFKIWETAALFALCVTLLGGVWAQGRQSELSGKLLRLHVIAASDEPEEQALKLRVRDAVLDYLSPLLAGAADRDAARAILACELENVRSAAARTFSSSPSRISRAASRSAAPSSLGER